jgi:CRISPR-associated protein Cas1
LDQTISYLHEPSDSRYSLSLDISEVFKINIVLPVIINMINKNMIIVERHFERKLNYCLLNEEGRKKFTIELEKKLDSTFMHSKLNRKVSYLTAIKLDGYKLIKNILEDKPFKPFSKKELC